MSHIAPTRSYVAVFGTLMVLTTVTVAAAFTNLGSIGETLIHEVGHYFGLSEEEIEAIEEQYWRGDTLGEADEEA